MVEQVFFLYISLLFEPHFYGLGRRILQLVGKKSLRVRQSLESSPGHYFLLSEIDTN
jgi:hypothetical protein